MQLPPLPSPRPYRDTELSATASGGEADKVESDCGGVAELGARAGGDAEGIVVVDWESASDPDNPLNWSTSRKWANVSCGIAFCFVVSISLSAYSIASEDIQRVYGCSSELAALTVTFFTVAFAVVPLLLGPLSEIHGRAAIYLVSAVLHTLIYIPEALVINLPTLIVLRFISGASGSAGICIVAGSIVDLFEEVDRGPPIAAFSLIAFGGPCAGSAIFGYVVERLGYAYVNWVLFATSGAITTALFFVLRESRATVLLERKAAALRARHSTTRYIALSTDNERSPASTLRLALALPLRMLFTEPVLAAFTAWISFTYGVLYLTLVSIPIVFRGLYGFKTGATGLIYVSQVVGVCLGFALDCACQVLYRRNVSQRGPEARLYTGFGAAFFIPVGAFLWAFTTYPHVFWLVPCVGMTLLYIGLFCCFLATHAYLTDTYTDYAASAVAAMLMCRNLVGAIISVVAKFMYDRLGIQGAGALTAGLGCLLSVIPVLLFYRGQQLRARSPFSRALRQKNDAGVASDTVFGEEEVKAVKGRTELPALPV